MLAREHMLSEGLVKELMQRDTERNKEWKRGSERPCLVALRGSKLRLLRGREVVADHFGASPVVEHLAGTLRGAQDRGHVQGGSGFSKVDLPWRFLCDPQLLFSTKRLFEAIPGGSEEPFEEGFEDHVADEAASAHSQRAQARHRGFEAPLRPL